MRMSDRLPYPVRGSVVTVGAMGYNAPTNGYNVKCA